MDSTYEPLLPRVLRVGPDQRSRAAILNNVARAEGRTVDRHLEPVRVRVTCVRR